MKVELNSRQIMKLLAKCWTINDMSEAFGVSVMTIHNWRTRGLPAVVISGDRRPALRFVPKEVYQWAAAYGIPMSQRFDLRVVEITVEESSRRLRVRRGRWHTEDVKILKRGLRQGLSTKELAAELGRTRDAVHGKGWRLGYWGNNPDPVRLH